MTSELAPLPRSSSLRPALRWRCSGRGPALVRFAALSRPRHRRHSDGPLSLSTYPSDAYYSPDSTEYHSKFETARFARPNFPTCSRGSTGLAAEESAVLHSQLCARKQKRLKFSIVEKNRGTIESHDFSLVSEKIDRRSNEPRRDTQSCRELRDGRSTIADGRVEFLGTLLARFVFGFSESFENCFSP